MEDVVIRYRADIDELIRKLIKLADENERIGTTSTQAQKGLDKTTQSVNRLEKEVADTGKKLKDATGATTQFGKTATGTFSGLTNQVQRFASGAAIALGAAFSVTAVVAFGKASISAFLEAQENAEKLRFAITQITGESEQAFQRLIKQSEQLQRTTVFSDDSIQQAQTMLATFGLTSNQIESLLPKLADFATVTKQDIVSAAQAVGRGLQGAGKEFKQYGIEVTAAKTELENLNAIMEGAVAFQGAATEATKTLTGELQQQANAADDLQEQIGEKLAPAWVKLKKAVFEGVLLFIDDFKRLASGDFSQLFVRDAEKAADALDVVTAKIKQRTQEAIESGIAQEQANKRAIESVKAAAIEEVKYRAELLKKALLVKDLDPQLLKGYSERLTEARNELRVLEQITKAQQDAAKGQEEDQKKIISLARIKAATQRELNELLDQQSKLSSVIAQSNVKNIQKEIDARKKQAEIDQKLLEELKKKYGEFAFIPPIELKVNFKKPDPSVLKELSDTLVIPVNLDITPADIKEDQTFFQKLFDEYGQQVQLTEQLLGELSGLFGSFTDKRIEEIQRTKDAELQALTTASDAIDEQVQRRQITEAEAAKKRDELTAKRVATEQAADKKLRELRRRQAILDKAAALFQIAIDTARNIVSQPGPAGVLIPFWASIGTVQAGAVVAQPIPAYKKGTKKAKGGLSLVGDDGPEMMMLPKDAKVMPAGKTKKYADIFDAMFDDRLESHILNRYINPALTAQKKRSEDHRQQSFATNISKALVFNSLQGMGKQPPGQVVILNADQIGQAIADQLRTDPYR